MARRVAFWEAAVSSGRNAKADGYDQYSNRDERVKNAGLAAVALAVTFNEGRPPHFPHDATKSTHWWEVRDQPLAVSAVCCYYYHYLRPLFRLYCSPY